ncbi:acetyl/propionyl/methylcrotonyl-CoA carboxylase subunit alpha [Paraburkholderia sp. BCC1886]|uniref:acetyl/propionyl/methylcrotonyl-CoA carboxylase subunit alpha n=1 Tax=Paraburkholderia sp. BCC1886 TaxID=2562670 RepID=UPI0011843B28|nr:acetyl-CoA carboxylase biotin carboxylase subunit [Paraburkholderia sp. BCC1886]
MRSINKLLIANRGEIAMRIMRTARAMGIRTVAIYSSADAQSLHVTNADEAVCVGEAPPADSYLNIAAIVAAALKSGADAVHPGYGFLSENAAFAEACVAAGLIFVGPPAHAIRSMGDKAQAKALMREAGLPCIPGYDGDAQDDRTLAHEAQKLGFPVIVKATAGGGGRGMRIVQTAADFERALDSARSEARNAFGSDRMIVERVVTQPRHIEIQVLIDQFGHGVHVGERDCSVQRRHQKVIEEAPAAHLAVATRERMGAAAVAAAIRLGYEGVGTFEFLLDARGEFYFMEMNTRLQVEHPVTEAIADIDLVEWQFRVAMGEPLRLTQAEIRLAGHSIEVRLCAEDEANGFMPQSGTIDRWQVPDTVRVEHAVESGSIVSPYYDSMFAKLIATGRTREDARRKLVSALRDTVVFGLKTNRQTLIRCLEHPAFVAGGVDTGFLQAYPEVLAAQRADADPLALALAGALLVQGGDRGPSGAGVQLRGARASTVHLKDDAAHAHTLQVAPTAAAGWLVTLGEQHIVFSHMRVDAGQVRFTLEGVDRRAFWHLAGSRIHVQLDGRASSFADTTYAPSSQADEGVADGRVRAMSNGRVAALLVAVGDAVQQGDDLLTVEAMKMEHTHSAPAAGRVTQILVAAGQSVATGKVLIELELEVPA